VEAAARAEAEAKEQAAEAERERLRAAQHYCCGMHECSAPAGCRGKGSWKCPSCHVEGIQRHRHGSNHTGFEWGPLYCHGCDREVADKAAVRAAATLPCAGLHAEHNLEQAPCAACGAAFQLHQRSIAIIYWQLAPFARHHARLHAEQLVDNNAARKRARAKLIDEQNKPHPGDELIEFERQRIQQGGGCSCRQVGGCNATRTKELTHDAQPDETLQT